MFTNASGKMSIGETNRHFGETIDTLPLAFVNICFYSVLAFILNYSY